MRSKTIITAMLDNGFLSNKTHNPIDYITYTTKAAKLLEASLKDVKQHEAVSELVASMFDAGFCKPEDFDDPTEWITFAESAVAELKVV